MCFSPLISGTFAIIGAVCTVIAYVHPRLRKQYTYILFAFYTLMEAFQTVQYSTVNQCGTFTNRALTEFAYLLVIVQPIMWNAIFYARVPPAQKRIFLVAILTCVVWICMHVMSRIPGLVQEFGLSSDVSAHQVTCTRRRTEQSHLYWQWSMADFHGMNANWLMYLCVWFIPCLVVAQTRSAGMALVIGALIGALITYKAGAKWAEFASTWCYISIPMMMLTFIDAFIIRTF